MAEKVPATFFGSMGRFGLQKLLFQWKSNDASPPWAEIHRNEQELAVPATIYAQVSAPPMPSGDALFHINPPEAF